jgi:hypothetical protein
LNIKKYKLNNRIKIGVVNYWNFFIGIFFGFRIPDFEF